MIKRPAVVFDFVLAWFLIASRLCASEIVTLVGDQVCAIGRGPEIPQGCAFILSDLKGEARRLPIRAIGLKPKDVRHDLCRHFPLRMRIAAGHAWILHEDDRFVPTRGTGMATKELRYYRIPVAAALNGGGLPDLSEISQYVAAKHPNRLDLPTDLPLAKFWGSTNAERLQIWTCTDNLLRMMADDDLTTRFGDFAEWEKLDRHQVPFDFIVENGATTQFLMRMEGTQRSSASLFPRRTEDTIYVIEYRIHHMGKDDGDPSGKYFFRDEILCTFDEGFHAVTGKDGYYFITESGTLFATRRTDEGQGKKTAEVRIRSGELVQAIVFDADRDNAAFAFTSNYWFEVKEPIEYHEFALPPLKLDDPMPTLVECAREVRKFYPAVPHRN